MQLNALKIVRLETAEERQAAMNRINEIVLETIRDINNAQTPQQVEAALTTVSHEFWQYKLLHLIIASDKVRIIV